MNSAVPSCTSISEMVNSISCVLVCALHLTVLPGRRGGGRESALEGLDRGQHVRRLFGLAVRDRGHEGQRETQRKSPAPRPVRLRDATAGQEEICIVNLYNPWSDEEAGRFSCVRRRQRHAARPPGAQSLESRLKQLFPSATSFSPKEGDPPHFTAYTGGAARRPWPATPSGRRRFCRSSAATAGRSRCCVGLDTNGQAHRRHRRRASRAVRRLLDRPAEVRRAVQEQGRPRPVQARRGHRRRLARDDHHVERGARDPQQLPAHGAPVPHGSPAPIEMIARARAARWRSFLLLVGIVVMSGWVAAAQPPGGGTTPPPGGGAAASRRRLRLPRGRRRRAELGGRYPRAGGGPRPGRRVLARSRSSASSARACAQVRHARRVGHLHRLLEEHAALDRQRLRRCSAATCRSSATAWRGICSPRSPSSPRSCGAASTAGASARSARSRS